MLQHLNIRTINNSFVSLSIDSEATIKAVKDYVGYHEGEMLLLYNGKILEDPSILSQSKIKNGDVLDVAYRCYGGMQIFVKTFQGKTQSMEVTSEMTIAELKNKIHRELGYPPEAQRLMFGSKQLESHHTLGQYGIPSEAAIYIVGRVLGGI